MTLKFGCFDLSHLEETQQTKVIGIAGIIGMIIMGSAIYYYGPVIPIAILIVLSIPAMINSMMTKNLCIVEDFFEGIVITFFTLSFVALILTPFLLIGFILYILWLAFISM